CQRMIQAVADRCACIIRVPQAEEMQIKQALDIGADGIIAPQVNSAEHAQRVADSCKYPPLGRRGVGIARAHGYGLDFADYLATANDRVSVVIQAEHVDAVANIDDIVAVEGIDAVLIGPYDLSASMGKPGEVSDPDVVDAIDTVTRACKRANVGLGFFGVNPEEVKPYIVKGYTLIVCGTDTVFLAGGAANTIDQLRGQ
ncbi:MAG: HpcH/HpaI aldolase/citrate lyase family protein, partial [Hyphomicrobiales bacterium]